MNSGNFDLKVKNAHYFQDGKKFKVKMDKLNFTNNGDVSMNGSDDNGDFVISGKVKQSGFIHMEKAYVGKWKVHYVGKMDGLVIKQCYDFEGNYDALVDKLKSGDVMSEIEFEYTTFRLNLVDYEEWIDMNLHNDLNDDTQWNGLAMKDNMMCTVRATLKPDYCDVHFSSGDYYERFEGTFDPDTKICSISFG